jgi:hypothetical protein
LRAIFPGTSHERSISSLSQLCPVFAVLPPAFEHIDIAERARVCEIELDNIIAIVERRPWV